MKNSFIFPNGVLLILLSILINGCNKDFQSAQVSSPDNKLKVNFPLDKNEKPGYNVSFENQTIIDTSSLGFLLKDAPDLNLNFEITETSQSTFDETWEPLYGEFSKIRNHYNELIIRLTEKSGSYRKMHLVFRVYNDGIGFRYEVPVQPNLTEVQIMSEETEFQFTSDHWSWWVPGAGKGLRGGTYEKPIQESSISSLDTVAAPFTMKTTDGLFLSIHEAALLDYPEMTLANQNKNLTLSAYLIPWPDGVKVKTLAPFKTPWRTIQVATRQGGLVESQLILNLNEPSVIEDESWIRSVKYIGIWWSLLLGVESRGMELETLWTDWKQKPEPKNFIGLGLRHGATTANAKKHIDFASKNGIPALLIEGWNTGWESWGKDDIFDWMTPYEDFNLEEVVRYGKEKGVVLIGHRETAGQIQRYEQRLDTTFGFYSELGIPIVKTGYAGLIRPEGMRRNGQYMVNHYTKVMQKAAEYKLMLDVHEPIKFTGLTRTYPNLLSGEGARGMEFNAFSGGISPEHTTILPFTRLLSGPMDYTPGIFDIKFDKHRAELIEAGIYQKDHFFRVHTTLAKQLAYYVIIYSPFQMAADLIGNYEGHPAFKFILDVLIDWAETKVLDAKIGDYVVMARKGKNSDDWFVGAITDENSRDLEVPLEFLDEGQKYMAEIYADAPETDLESNPTAYIISRHIVTKDTILKMKLAESGGQAVSLFPVSEAEAEGLPKYIEKQSLIF